MDKSSGNSRPASKSLSFEAFVQRILAVPKDAIQEAEAQRIKRAKPRRFRIKAKK